MQRRNFLSTTAVFGFTLTQTTAEIHQAPTAPFVIRSGESRFQESTQVGLSPNNIKVSSKDTNGQLTVFEYIGKERGGLPLHIHPNQDEIFFIVEGEYLFQVGKEQFRLKSGILYFCLEIFLMLLHKPLQLGSCFLCFNHLEKWKISFGRLVLSKLSQLQKKELKYLPHMICRW
jgi:quercetin 2,3-dioxygenase